ncbi:hypothetical protein ABW21_db0201094 [Orbilia brochopaga]|nr:hypothetical protein ABW21_db0201094 [Drechslerella brochopaga]
MVRFNAIPSSAITAGLLVMNELAFGRFIFIVRKKTPGCSLSWWETLYIASSAFDSSLTLLLFLSFGVAADALAVDSVRWCPRAGSAILPARDGMVGLAAVAMGLTSSLSS